MIEALLFDMDGLLLDTERMQDKIWDKAKEHFHYDFNEAFKKEMRGINIRASLKVYEKYFGKNFDYQTVLKWRRAYFMEMAKIREYRLKKVLWSFYDMQGKKRFTVLWQPQQKEIASCSIFLI